MSSSLVNVHPPAKVAYKSSTTVEGHGTHDGSWKLLYQAGFVLHNHSMIL